MATAAPSDIGIRARLAARRLAPLGRADKDAALDRIAQRVLGGVDDILQANAVDVAAAEAAGTSGALLDRLTLDRPRVEALAAAVRAVAALPDPIGLVDSGWRLPNG